MSNCELCGEPMPEGEEMFKYHGYSGDCPKPPAPIERPSTSEMHALICAIIQDEAKYDPATNTWDVEKAATAIIAAFDGA